MFKEQILIEVFGLMIPLGILLGAIISSINHLREFEVDDEEKNF